MSTTPALSWSPEDPALGAHLAKSAVAGIQSEGVVATVKHYVLNNQEQNRNTVSVTVDERTFMELYFPPFQGAIDAGVGAVMCSYNLINGTHACGNNATLNKYLKEVGGFDGFVMSDWDATHTPGRSPPPLATDNLLEHTDGVLRPPHQSFSVLSGRQPATFYLC